MAAESKVPSEFGGGPGKVFGDGHPLTPAEEMRLARATDPTSPSDDAAAALIREWESEGRL